MFADEDVAAVRRWPLSKKPAYCFIMLKSALNRRRQGVNEENIELVFVEK